MRERSAVVILRVLSAAAALLAPIGAALAQESTAPGDEAAIGAYLAMWSHNADVNAAAVERFYAPRVSYYGKRFTRAEVLADKLRYIKAWPVRHYEEVPGTIKARCNADRTLCRVSVIMTARRVGRDARVSFGRARIAFDFVPVEGGRKIARESARTL